MSALSRIKLAEMERLRAENERLRVRIEALERDLSIEVAAGHDSTERAEAAEAELATLRASVDRVREELQPVARRLGEINRDEEAGIRIVLARNLAELAALSEKREL
jgi:predicted  nucleic acid-binding Zn-ribbon protein